MRDDDKRKTMGINARKKILECFNDKDRVKPVIETIEKVTGKSILKK